METANAVRLGKWQLWLALLFFVPLVLPYRWLPVPNYYQDAVAYALAALGALAVSVEALRRHDTNIQVAMFAWTPLLLAAVLVVQQLAGKIHYVQHFVLPFGALILAATTVTVSYWRLAPKSEDVLRVVAMALVAAGLLNALWGIVQVAGYELKGFELVERAPGPYRVAGLIAQPNQLSVVLLWSLLGALYLWFAGRLSKRTATALALVFMIALAFAASRATYVYLLVVAPTLAHGLRRLRLPQWWLPLAAAAVYPALDLAVRSLLPIADPATAAQVVRPLDGASAAVRMGFIRDGWELFLSSPWLGVGWHQFIVARWAMSDATMLELHADHAHNIVINLLAEVGILGLGVVVLGTLLWVWRAVSKTLTVERAVVLSMIAVIALYSLFEFPLWFGHFLIPTAVLVGLLETRHVTFTVTRSFSALRTTTAALLLGATGLLAVDYARVEAIYRAYFRSEQVQPPTMDSVLALTNATLYREEAEQIYLLTAPIDAFQASFNGEMSARVFAGFPAPQFAVVRAAHLLYAGDEEQAAYVLGRTCRWLESSCQEMRNRFMWLAQNNGEPFKSFVARRLDSALPVKAKDAPPNAAHHALR